MFDVTRKSLSVGASFWYYRWGQHYRVVILDTDAYNSKNTWGPPVKAKSKTAKGVYVQYVDKETGQPGETSSVSAKAVVSIDQLRGTWDEYLVNYAEQEAQAKLHKAQAEQGKAEKDRIMAVTKKHNERFKEADVNLEVSLASYGTLPGMVSYGGSVKPAWTMTVTGEDVLAFIAKMVLEAVDA